MLILKATSQTCLEGKVKQYTKALGRAPAWSLSHVQLSAAPWTVARQAPLTMGFSRQKYWKGLPCPSSGNLHNPGPEHKSLPSPELAGRFFTSVLVSLTASKVFKMIKIATFSVSLYTDVSNSLQPMDWGPPGSSVRGIFQARALEWGAISFSNTFLRWFHLSPSLGSIEMWRAQKPHLHPDLSPKL